MKIFAIEFTNWCNAKCGFCPYPTPAHTRTKGWMEDKTLRQIIDIIEEPKAINISGLGEPTLHKLCVAFVMRLTDADIKVQLNTNGQKLDQRMYDALYDAGLHQLIITSDYFPWRHGSIVTKPDLPVKLFTITREPDHPELGQVRKPLDDWGGQVGRVDRPDVRCSFLHDDFVQIMWNGDVQRCCVDFNGNHSIGNIFDDAFLARYNAGEYRSKPIPLCNGCHGYVFKDGLVAGDYEGKGATVPDAFVPLTLPNKDHDDHTHHPQV